MVSPKHLTINSEAGTVLVTDIINSTTLCKTMHSDTQKERPMPLPYFLAYQARTMSTTNLDKDDVDVGLLEGHI